MNPIYRFHPVVLFLFFCVMPVVANAQIGNVAGTVTESARNLTLAGVSVRVEGQGIQTVTDVLPDVGHHTPLPVESRPASFNPADETDAAVCRAGGRRTRHVSVRASTQ